MITKERYQAALERASVPQIPQGQGWTQAARRKVALLTGLKDNFDSDGAEAPNEFSLGSAKDILELLEAVNLRPDKISPAALGGVAFIFRKDALYVGLIVYNDGELLVESKGEGGWVDVFEGSCTAENMKVGVARANELLS